MHAELERRFRGLEDRRRAIVARLDEHDRVRLNRPRDDGGWSALQVLHHVITAEEGTCRYVSKKMLAGTSLPRAGVASRLRLLTLQAALASPLRFQAPAVTAVVPPQVDPQELRTRWEGVRGDWQTLLGGFPEELLDRMVFRHVLVGLMGLPDTLAFLRSHLDHHARQVEGLLNAEGASPSP